MTTVVFLAACSTDPTATAETTMTDATAVPSVAPTPTPDPYQDFSIADVPPADPERLAQLSKLLSLVPESYDSAVYLDMKFLRSDASLADAISPELLGFDLALPSIATGLVNAIAVAADFQTGAVVTPFHSDFTISEMIQLAGSFGLPLSEGGPEQYEGHDIWEINALGAKLAMAAAADTTGVAASGSDAVALAKASLDAFDGRSDRLLNAPGLSGLIGEAPSGFAAMVLSQCGSLQLFADVQALPACTSAVVTADILSENLVVIHAIIGFVDEDQARSALELANDALESQYEPLEIEDLAVLQEGDRVWVRVIVDVSKLTDAFRLFAPGT